MMVENKLCIFVSLFLVILLESWRRLARAISRNLPPGPLKLPIIGNLHQLVGSQPHHRLTELAKKYGSIMHLQLGQVSFVVISSPEVAKEVMKTHDLIFASRPFNPSANIITYNSRDIAFAPYGAYWRQLKKICILELLSAKRVKSFKSIREEEVSSLIAAVASGASSHEQINLSRNVRSMSNSITYKAAFGMVRKQKEAFTPIVQNILRLIGGFSIPDLFPSFKLLEVICGMSSGIQKLHQEADAILEEIINEHRERNKSENTEPDDLVDVLLNLQDNGMLDIPLTTQDIKAVILDMFAAGIDTSSTTIEWVMSEMVKHGKVMERAQAEVRQVFGGREKIDEEMVNNLTYLDSVIKETLRLHPPLPLLLPREAPEGVEICGYKIPAKSQVIINAQAIGRHPDSWVEAEEFKPERFVNSSIDYKGNELELIPFGAGRRMCPGILFGMSIVKLALANLLFHFDWEIPNQMEPHDLDMEQIFGAVVSRKNDLLLVPIPHNSLLSNKR